MSEDMIGARAQLERDSFLFDLDLGIGRCVCMRVSHAHRTDVPPVDCLALAGSDFVCCLCVCVSVFSPSIFYRAIRDCFLSHKT
ncbi:unnamed protein product [Periconia digitata]|uniref:Uncharacterized protein n=1 Tax=Periconia digitata TaxID=1303443 RepID=A0A9W4UMP5_9PLEO|nr:unnamed protein product [Periconia digitata]